MPVCVVVRWDGAGRDPEEAYEVVAVVPDAAAAAREVADLQAMAQRAEPGTRVRHFWRVARQHGRWPAPSAEERVHVGQGQGRPPDDDTIVLEGASYEEMLELAKAHGMDPERRVELDGMTARVTLNILDGLAALLHGLPITDDQATVLTNGRGPFAVRMLEAALLGTRQQLRRQLDG